MFTISQALQHFFIAMLINKLIINSFIIQIQFYSNFYNNFTLNIATFIVSLDFNIYFNYSLYFIKTFLTKFNKRFIDFSLLSYIYNQSLQDTNLLLTAKLSYNQAKQDNIFFNTYYNLNSNQLAIFNTIINYIYNNLYTIYYFV